MRNKSVFIFILIIVKLICSTESTISKCEKLIKRYNSQKNNSTKEYYNNNDYNYKLICNEKCKNHIFKVCKKDLIKWYKIKMKNNNFDIENPKTYNEKIQWMKLYDNSSLKTQLTDKYLVRNWVKEKIGEKYLIPLLGVWDSFDEINFDLLPNQFVLKANHGCQFNIIVKNKSELNIEEARKKMNEWLKINFAFKYGFEFQYLNIKPKIIAEKYIENINGDVYDYKVFCFNGKAESILVINDRKTNLKISFYDLNWNKLDYIYSFLLNKDIVPKPKNLNLLIELAEKLAEGFPHVRVDFYILNDGTIKFGEMTFSSASGTCNWNPIQQDKIFGDLIKLPPKKKFVF
ncbi:TupA-like ATPgrasp-domain-containing protein [Neocallimastix lanati (nom. inval.)]|nr:TupA-like ATPgrasp-domain-containing protein [Neocallimastix sp. JGI-2020a]